MNKCYLMLVFLSVVSACQHHPKNKAGKPYDHNSARCIWKDGHLLKGDSHRQLFDENGHQDHFEQALEQQESDRRIEMECETSHEYHRRRNKADLQTEIDKALSKNGRAMK